MSETLLPLSMLKASPHNPRQLGGKDLTDLAASINSKGVRIPLIVRPIQGGDAFEVVDGHRRMEAVTLNAKANKLKLADIIVPVLVYDLSDDEAAEMQLISNIQREGFHYLDESAAIQSLIGRGYDVKGIAVKLGKTETFVVRRLALVQLIPKVRELAEKGALPVNLAEYLAPLSPETQKKFLEKHVHIYDTQGKKGKSCSVDSLATVRGSRGLAEDAFLDLKKAPWGMEDAELVPAAGPCSTCPKRVGTKALLFDGIDPQSCTDARCFDTKANAWVKQKVATLEAEGNKVSLISMKSYSYHGVKRALLQETDWRLAVKQECESASLGIVIEESWDEKQPGLGKVLAICIDKKCKTHWGRSSGGYELSPHQKAKNRKEYRRRQFEQALRTRQVNAYCEELEKTKKPEHLGFANMRRVAAVLFERVGHDTLKEIARGMGATKEELRDPREFVKGKWKALTTQTAKAFMMRMAVGDVLFTRWKQAESVARLEAAMADEGMATVQKKLEAEVRKDLEAKWAKLDARGKGGKKKSKVKPKDDAQKGGEVVRKGPKAKKVGAKQSGPPEDKKIGKKWYL